MIVNMKAMGVAAMDRLTIFRVAKRLTHTGTISPHANKMDCHTALLFLFLMPFLKASTMDRIQ